MTYAKWRGAGGARYRYGLVVLIAAVMTATASADESSASARDLDVQLIERLHGTIIDVSYDGTDFDEILAELAQKHGLNVHIAWRTMEDRGLRRDRRIDMWLHQVSVATVLDLLLREVSTSKLTLGFYVRNGILIIGEELDVRPMTYLRRYDVTDLVDSGYAIRRFASTPVLSMRVTGREFIGGEARAKGGSGGGGSIFGDPGADPARGTSHELIEQIINLVMENVDVESWLDTGGDVGNIRVFGTSLLVNHTAEAHTRIEKLLAMLREMQPRSIDADVMVVRLQPNEVTAWRDDVGASFPRLTGAQFEAAWRAAEDGRHLMRATTSGANGERLWFSALTQRDLVIGATPVVGDGASGFAPRTGFVTEGLELIALPLVAPGSSDLTLDVQMAWVPPSTLEERSVTLAAGPTESRIDRVKQRMRTVSTTVRLRLGEGIALSIPSQLADDGRTPEWEDWLVVRVREPAAPALAEHR